MWKGSRTRDGGDGQLAMHDKNDIGLSGQELKKTVGTLTFCTAPSWSISIAHCIAITL